MIIYLTKKHQIIVVAEGTGDNLTREDEADGIRDYWMSSLYEVNGEEIKLLEQSQILTSHLIAELSQEEQVDIIKEYWEVNTEPCVAFGE